MNKNTFFEKVGKLTFSVVLTGVLVTGIVLAATGTWQTYNDGDTISGIEWQKMVSEITGKLNKSDIPTCLAGESLTFDGTNFTCFSKSIPTDFRSVNSYKVENLIPNKKYLVSVYGFTRNQGTGNHTMSGIYVKKCGSNVNLGSIYGKYINWPDGSYSTSGDIVITAPSDGCIRGIVDTLNAKNMTVIQLN